MFMFNVHVEARSLVCIVSVAVNDCFVQLAMLGTARQRIPSERKPNLSSSVADIVQ